LASIARSGAKAGHRKVYGIDVPTVIWPWVVREARIFRNVYCKKNLPAARAFVRYLVERGQLRV
jgi:hypothetical protein